MTSLSFLTVKDFIRGQLVSWFFTAPEKRNFHIQGYEKLKVLKRSPDGRLEIGIYKKGDNKFLIKSLFARKDSLEYKHILNEMSLLRFFEAYSPLNIDGYQLSFPRILDIFLENERILLIREYVVGNPLEEFSGDFQRKIFSLSLKAFSEISKKIDSETMKTLPRRSNALMVLSFPIYVLIASIRYPRYFVYFIKAVSIFIRCISSINPFKTSYTATHRDIHPGNIIVHDKKIAIIDIESTVFSEDGSDMAISFLNFYQHDDIDGNIAYLKSLSSSSEIYRKFILLSIFYMVRLIASDANSEEEFAKKTREYFLVFVDRIVPVILW